MLWWWASLALAGELRLDVDGAMQRAWERAVDRAVGEAAVQVARDGVRGARAPADPELRVRVRDVGSAVRPTTWNARVRQDLAPLGSLRAAGRAAEAEADVLRAELELDRALLRLDTAHAFDGARVAAASEAIALDEVVLCRRRLELAERRLAAGLDVADDVVEAEIAILGAVRRGREAAAERAAAEALLARLVHAGPDDVLVLEGPALLELALGAVADGTPDAELALLGAEAAEVEARIQAESTARRVFLSWVEAGFGMRAGRVPSLQFGAAIDVPVFSLSDGVVRAARAELAGREAIAAAHRSDDAARRASARRVLDAARDGLAAVQASIDDASARLAALGERIAPDRRVELEVDLVGERRRLLDLVALALEARREIEG